LVVAYFSMSGPPCMAVCTRQCEGRDWTRDWTRDLQSQVQRPNHYISASEMTYVVSSDRGVKRYSLTHHCIAIG